jgi:hypothetical protein
LLSYGCLLNEGRLDVDEALGVNSFESSISDTVAKVPELLLAQIVNCITHFEFEAVLSIVLHIVSHWNQTKYK